MTSIYSAIKLSRLLCTRCAWEVGTWLCVCRVRAGFLRTTFVSCPLRTHNTNTSPFTTETRMKRRGERAVSHVLDRCELKAQVECFIFQLPRKQTKQKKEKKFNSTDKELHYTHTTQSRPLWNFVKLSPLLLLWLLQMAVNILAINFVNPNPCPWESPFAVELTFECIQYLPEGKTSLHM